MNEAQHSQELHKAGLKATAARIRVSCSYSSRARTAPECGGRLQAILLEAGNEIGLATVYRVLSQFETAGS